MITKAALLLFRGGDGKKELLFLKAAGKPHFIFPGGKQEQGETVIQALHRELLEELGVTLTGIRKLGEVSGATPDGRPLEMHLYKAEVVGKPRPQSEIKQMIWLSRDEALKRKDEMTPITLSQVFPFLDRSDLW